MLFVIFIRSYSLLSKEVAASNTSLAGVLPIILVLFLEPTDLLVSLEGSTVCLLNGLWIQAEVLSTASAIHLIELAVEVTPYTTPLWELLLFCNLVEVFSLRLLKLLLLCIRQSLIALVLHLPRGVVCLLIQDHNRWLRSFAEEF